MNYKNKFFIIGLILLISLTVSMVSAEENHTDVSVSEMDYISEDISSSDDGVISEQNTEVVSRENNGDSELGVIYPRNTRITVDSVTINQGEKITFTAHVETTVQKLKVPGNVTFSRGSLSYTRNLDDDGYATLTLSKSFSPGSYEWTATYNMYIDRSTSTHYRFEKSTANFNLNVKGNASITVNDYDSYYNSGENYQIKVLNTYDKKTISNLRLKLDFYDANYNYVTSYVTTDKNGIYKCVVNSTPGTYKIIVSIADNNYKTNKATINVNVKKTPIQLTANDIVSTTTATINLKANVKDIYGNNVIDGKINFLIDGNNYESNVNEDIATYTLSQLKAGTHNVIASFISDKYESNNVSFNIIINKASVKIVTYKWISTTKQYATLKAIVKSSNNKNINEGTVKFTINGKTYNVKVKNGVATKNVKLTKAKTYSYKATFSDDKYEVKSSSSKVIVKKAKKWYTYKYGKLMGKISYKQYTTLLKAYNAGKYKELTVKTGKYNTYKVPKYKYKKVTKYKWQYKKVLRSEYWSWDGGSEWEDYDTWEKYTKKGWTWYGTTDTEKTYSDGSYYSAHYYKLKKKVKVTEKVKVKNGYKKVKYPIRMVISSTEGYNGFSIDFYDSYGGFLDGGLRNTI